MDLCDGLVNLAVGCRQLLHGGGDLVQLVTGSLEIADHPLELSRRTLDHLARLANIVIDVLVLALRLAHQVDHAADVAADLLGGDIDPLGQLAHLIGHHRKAASHFAGPRRLDGGIQGQQVGLVGNILDQAGDLPDAVGALRQMIDRGVEGAEFVADHHHLGDDIVHFVERQTGRGQIGLGRM